MEAIDLTEEAFWDDAVNHIAVNPARAQDAEGLAMYAMDELQARGWCFFQTSGSEGLPKWVGLEKAAFVESARWVNAHFALGAADHWCLALPLHHVGGFAIGARAMLTGSRVSVFPSRWEAREFAVYAEAQGITVVSLVPAQVYDLVSAQVRCPVSLKTVIVGGGALSDALATRALALGWQVRRTYGMTEAASMIAAQRSSEDAMMEVLPHWQVRVDEGDALLIKGPSLARGYVIRAADGRWCWEVIEPMAGLRTRDHVSLSAHAGRHYLAFIGRESSFVKILGELVNVVALQQRLDDALLQSGLHRSAVLVPLPDQRRETRLVLAVPPGMAAEERARLLAVYHASCQPYEHVSEIVEVEVIPRSGLGKVETGRLREALMRRAGEAS